MNNLNNKKWLREKYCIENLSQTEIGRLVGVSGERVRQCLRKFGLHKKQQFILIQGNNLLKKNCIINGKQKFQSDVNLLDERGIYFLIYKKEIIYIGSTNNLYRRLKQQVNDFKKWDSYSFIPISKNLDLEWEERRYIKEFKPIFNKRINVVDISKSKTRKEENYGNRKN